MMTAYMRIGSIAGVLMLALTGVALAEDNPCKADGEKFCSEVKGGDLHVLKCMIDKLDELSPACQAFLKKSGIGSKGQVSAWRQECGDDIPKHCKSVMGKPTKVKECLTGKLDEVSAACKKALTSDSAKDAK